MSSRRMITRSYSGNGRSGHVNGDDVSGSGRPSSRSYLSDVRPENSRSSHRYSRYRSSRSTLCSVMAQLTEDTQPSFETTLKSKAVSENCNVKFTCVVTGYPTPEVIWYKDDMQLDRYCGLPKYEIFRNGQNHSLHIYNCTVEDAAIYQASASNNKGIVSCSGVLEVGVMNEYNIHQRYFAKLKQTAENKRRELEGKENQGPPDQLQPLRTISPDRTQRKRRSPMEASLSTPSSMEDEGIEESHPTTTFEAEARLKEVAVGQTEESSIPTTTVTVSPIMNGQVINDNGSKSATYTYDAVQKIFTSYQPKTPFVKKKIKISDVEENVKADVTAEKMSGGRKVDGEACVVPSPTESSQHQGCSVEVMDVMSSTDTLNSNSIKETEPHQKKTTDEALSIKIPSDDKKVHAEGHAEVHVQGKLPSVPLYSLCPDVASPTVLPPTNRHLSRTERKKVKELEKGTGHCDGEENSELHGLNPSITATQPQSTPQATAHQPSSNIAEEDKIKGQQEEITAMEVEEKPHIKNGQLPTVVPPAHEASEVAVDLAKHSAQHLNTTGPIHHTSPVHSSLESADRPREAVAASLQPKHVQSSDQLSETETSNGQKNASVSQPSPQGEVTWAYRRTNRNDAPVNLEPQPTPCAMDEQLPLKTPSERETATDDNQTGTLRNPVQAAFDEMTRDTWDHSMGSSESHTVLFTGIQKSPLESPGDEENTPGCNISPTVQLSQVEKAIKTVAQTEIKVDKKAEGNDVGTLEIQRDNLCPNAKGAETETEVLSLKLGKQAEVGRTVNGGEKEMVKAVIEDAACYGYRKKETVMKKAEETHSESQSLKAAQSGTASPHVTKNPKKTRIQKPNKAEQHIKDLRKIPTPVSKVTSISGLLRSRMKALDVTGDHSAATETPKNPDEHLFPTTNETKVTAEKGSGLGKDNRDRKLEVKKSKTDRQTEVNGDAGPAANVKSKPFRVHHSLTQTKSERIQPSQIQSSNTVSPNVEVAHEPAAIPSISVIDIGTVLKTGKCPSSPESGPDSIMDTGQQSGPLPLISVKDDSGICHSSTENVLIDVSPDTPKQEHGEKISPTTRPAECPSPKASTLPTVTPTFTPSAEKRLHSPGAEFTQTLTPELQCISDTHWSIAQTDSTALLDKHKGHKTTTSGLDTVQSPATESAVFPTVAQGVIAPLAQPESSLPTAENVSNPEGSPLRIRNGTPPIPSATPQELASGARRKIFIPKSKTEDSEATSPADSQSQKEEVSSKSSGLSPGSAVLSASPTVSRRSPLLQPSGPQTPPADRRSPLFSRRKVALDPPTPTQEPNQQLVTLKTEEKTVEKKKHDPFKAPQVIRKIRGESFSDASGHLKLWCQFFNVLSDSTIKWCRDEAEIARVERSAGDETQVNLAIVQASHRDCGVYGCTITNEHGTDSTDFLLSADILAGMSLREDLGVGEEIEMTPLVLNKGVADSGVWGNKFFGRVMMQESHIGEGCSHKVWRAKVIYGLEPVFESGTTCIIKVCSPITYGGKQESHLVEKNMDITQRVCRIQNLAREYCKIFSAEARVIENFGKSLEVIPVYLMYRPANTIPHAIVEADLKGVYLKYSLLDDTDRLVTRTASEVEQKCCTLQHWIYQWTNGNLLLTRMEGVDTKITNVGISVKSTGYQGLSVTGNPKVFEQFVSQHQCNYYCGLLSLRSLKATDSLQMASKPKGSRSPLLQRKMATGSSSPQPSRKAVVSPRLPRKSESEHDSNNTPAKQITDKRSLR